MTYPPNSNPQGGYPPPNSPYGGQQPGYAPQPGYGQQPAPYGQQPYGQPSAAGFPQGGYNPYGAPPAPVGNLASWGIRVGAFLLDGLIPAAFYVVFAVLFGLIIGGSSGRVGSGGATIIVILGVVGWLGAVAFAIWNYGYRQGTTGQTLGKKWVGIKLVGMQTGQPVGFGAAFLRQIAHVLDGIPLYIGYLWPLWDVQRQTFADKVCNTVVVYANR